MSAERFNEELPIWINAFKILEGTWKYEFDKKTHEEVDAIVNGDGRPGFCKESFPGFEKFSTLELGPGDGYLSAGLERCGCRDILSIEGSRDGFIRCLILKNELNLHAKYLYGDFVKYVNHCDREFDLIFAAGILYHLVDPVGFIKSCGKIAKNLFIWTLYYDEEIISKHEYERSRFDPTERLQVEYGGSLFTYHRRAYDSTFVSSNRYTGGIYSFAYWLSKDDLFKALDICGFDIVKTVQDENNGLPAINICATRRQ